MRIRAYAALPVAEIGEPPVAFRIWSAGENETDHGSFTFDEKAAASVMAAYKERGNKLSIDYDHKSLDTSGPATAGKAAGWFVPEVRAVEGGAELWASQVEWTPAAAKALSEKEWRYFSPAFDVDKKSKRIVHLVNVALTNVPATHNLEPLVARGGRVSARDERVRASIGMSFNELRSLLDGALAERIPRDPHGSPMGPHISDVFDATIVYELDGKIYELGYTFDGKTATLAAAPTEVRRGYEPLAQTTGAQGSQAHKATGETVMLNDADKALAGEWLAAVKDLATKATDEKLKELAASVMTALEAMLGEMAAPAVAAATAVKSESAAIVASVRRATGKSTAPEIEASLRGLTATRESHGDLATKFAALEADLAKRETRELVMANRTKVSPTLETWALSQTPDALRAFLAVAPAIVETASGHRPPPVETSAIALTDEDRMVCRVAGTDPEKFLAHKRVQATRIAARAAQE